MKNSSLVVVGSGIKFVSHLTTETKAYIRQSDKVLYLVNDPAMKEWIVKNNVNSESLDQLYIKHPLRKDCYQAITEYILAVLQTKQHVCVVIYGHPLVLSQSALNAVHLAQKENYYVKVLPAISTEDCLFADLLVDPGVCGCLSFEATDLLIHGRQIDPSCHVILWQVGAIGVLGHTRTHDNAKGAKLLVTYLNRYYALTHEVILYEAAQYPGFEPTINKVTLENLPESNFSSIYTLYIPPAYKASCDKKMLSALGLNISDL